MAKSKKRTFTVGERVRVKVKGGLYSTLQPGDRGIIAATATSDVHDVEFRRYGVLKVGASHLERIIECPQCGGTVAVDDSGKVEKHGSGNVPALSGLLGGAVRCKASGTTVAGRAR